MQRNLLKSAAFAALALVPVPAEAAVQATATTAASPQLSTLSSNSDISRFYTASKNAPIWLRAGQGDAGTALVNILRLAPLDGFARGPQLATEIEAALAKAQADPASSLEAEYVMSNAWIAYVQAIHAPTPGMLYGEKWVMPAVPSSFQVLREALNAPSLAQHLKSVSDINPIYSSLRELAVSEAKLPGGGNSARYAANLERARSIPAKGKFVLVDAATQRLWMYEDGHSVDSMKVIVGDKDKLGLPTPMIASVIWYATFNPYWHVPDHLVKKTLAAHVIKDGEAYLKKNGYEVVADWDGKDILPASSVDWKAAAAGTVHVKIRQLPGPTNSMGKLKFNFANPEGVYLHDTPNKALFAQSNRALSNGCIRLEDAKRLGRWLMGREPVAPSTAAEQHVTLPGGVPVYVTYLTAQPNIGEPKLVRDVYGWDARSTVSTAAAMQAAAAGS